MFKCCCFSTARAQQPPPPTCAFYFCTSLCIPQSNGLNGTVLSQFSFLKRKGITYLGKTHIRQKTFILHSLACGRHLSLAKQRVQAHIPETDKEYQVSGKKQLVRHSKLSRVKRGLPPMLSSDLKTSVPHISPTR